MYRWFDRVKIPQFCKTKSKKKASFLKIPLISLSYKHAYVRFMFTFKFSSLILCDTNGQP